jgi:hypothetical protein
MKVDSDVNHALASFLSVVDRGREKSQPLTTGAEARSFIASSWLSDARFGRTVPSCFARVSPVRPDLRKSLTISNGEGPLSWRTLQDPPASGLRDPAVIRFIERGEGPLFRMYMTNSQPLVAELVDAC